ncbi:DUF3263 domain-containing protein [Nocardia macrotermitis]|uniref:DUF3263 domain-containing protein n=1 Tax=Nocardia macrotermitis TaxID=2585198 RepID=A0A7K0DDS3_9NOCA|nr:DUF3263 domain-containing protein [Nocardia macrotermitis]MQY23769.1 hypothetical protein [Nocardia macrotermitis]
MDSAAARNLSASEDSSSASEVLGTPDTEIPNIEAPETERLVDGLDRRELDILDFERKWWKYAGAKEEAIRELFGMSATRYYQVLNAVVDKPEALVADPMLVKRLRRLRASRQKARAARRLGFQV